jgi:hypothetical protein
MATAMFAETVDNSQHSTLLNPESRSRTLTQKVSESKGSDVLISNPDTEHNPQPVL